MFQKFVLEVDGRISLHINTRWN